jgi:hypothetical protein
MLKLPKTPAALLSPRGILNHLAGVSSSVRAAIFFAYWLFLAGMGLLSGQGVFGSLFVALLALVVLIGLVVVQRWSEMTLPTSTGGRLALHSVTALTLVVGWFVLFVPVLMLMALLLWGLFALPLWLIR